MCGRFTLTRSPAEIAEAFGLDPADVAGLRPRFNIAPTQSAPVVIAGEGASQQAVAGQAGRALVLKRWGLVPHWASDPGIASHTINARIETAAQKPAFRAAMAQRRCLAPADGFYEWRRRGTQRDPYHVRFPDGESFAIAGLHETWSGPGGLLETFTLLTCAAHTVLRGLHDRMPALIAPEHFDAWLDPGETDVDRALSLPDPELAARFEIHAVDARVNSTRYDDPACLAPAPQLSLL
jgi:putative SOS response-associated peptidase YedK